MTTPSHSCFSVRASLGTASSATSPSAVRNAEAPNQASGCRRKLRRKGTSSRDDGEGCVVFAMSWVPQAITDSGQWVGNRLRFATKEEAETCLAELYPGRTSRAVESSDPVNYRWEYGRLVHRRISHSPTHFPEPP